MDVDRFLRELPRLFDDVPDSELPRDVRFAEVLEAVRFHLVHAGGKASP